MLAFETRGSIASATRVPVAIVASYAFLIWLLDRLALLPSLGSGSSSLVGVISGVTGLLVAFRSSSSSDRWHEGRRLWANVTASSRTLMRTLALSLPPPSSRRDARQMQLAQETIALVPAFAYALKDHLRELDAFADHDVRHLLSAAHLASLTPRSARPTLPAEKSAVDVAAKDVAREVSGLNTASAASLATRASPSAHRSSNAPLAIIGQLHATLNAFHVTPTPSIGSPDSGEVALDTPTWANCLGVLQSLTETVTHMERIRDTPIPMSLAIHMQQLIGLYVLAVPLQLVFSLGIMVIPVSALAAWVYYGVDLISQELSDPFGTEPNDLPLDKFCADMRREYREVVGAESDISVAGLSAPEDAADRLKAE